MNRLVFVVVLALAGFRLVTSIPNDFNVGGYGQDGDFREVQVIDVGGLFGSIAKTVHESINLAQNSIKHHQQQEDGEKNKRDGCAQGGDFSGLFGSIADIVNESIKLGQRVKQKKQFENEMANRIRKDPDIEFQMLAGDIYKEP